MERKEAIEVIKKNWPDSSFTMLREALETLVPELNESEDEKIRKEIIEIIDSYDVAHLRTAGLPTRIPKYLAWLEKQGNANKEYWRGYREGKQEILDKYTELEKQGEQKPADKIEPKFKQGDIIKEKETGNLFYVNSVEEFGYTLHYKDCIEKGCVMSFKYEDNYEIAEQASAWSEEDEVVVKDICDKLNRLSMTYVGNESIVCQEDINWLKSLKERCTWKPSKKQLEALEHSLGDYNIKVFEDRYEILKSLYKNLKKLREGKL